MPGRLWPVGRGCFVTSPFAMRWGQMHWGIDLGKEGGSANMPVYAAQDGTVVMRGNAGGFSSNRADAMTGWVVVDHPAEAGAGTTVYGHVVAQVNVGDRVVAGQQIARVNPDRFTNGGQYPDGMDPHLHFEVHKTVWSANGADRRNPLPWLDGAGWPGGQPPGPIPVAPPTDEQSRAVWNEILKQQTGYQQ